MLTTVLVAIAVASLSVTATLIVLKSSHARAASAAESHWRAELDRVRTETESARHATDSLRAETERLRGEKHTLKAELDNARARALEDRKRFDAELRQALEQRAEVRAAEEALRATLDAERRAIAAREVEFAQFQKESREALESVIENKVTRLVKEKGGEMTEASKKQLDALLKPFREQMQAVEKKVQETHATERQMHGSLIEQIKHITHATQTASATTQALTEALSGESKFQGDWGEMQLVALLESAGFQEGREFETQRTFDVKGEKLRPDTVLHLPGERSIVVDAKVTLKHFHAYTESQDQRERARFAQETVRAFKARIDELAGKYAKLPGLNQLDVVWMFVPVEGAFALVQREWRDVMDYAAKQGVVPMMPSSLLVSLAIVHEAWKHENRHDDAVAALAQVAKLYEKLRTFMETWVDLDQKLVGKNGVVELFEKAKGQLVDGRGNLVNQAEALAELRGVTPKKRLPAKAVTAAREADPVLVLSGGGE